jgi:hypothetical protein
MQIGNYELSRIKEINIKQMLKHVNNRKIIDTIKECSGYVEYDLVVFDVGEAIIIKASIIDHGEIGATRANLSYHLAKAEKIE